MERGGWCFLEQRKDDESEGKRELSCFILFNFFNEMFINNFVKKY